VLRENLLRDGEEEGVEAVAKWVPTDEPGTEIACTPARVLMQDFTGVPAIVVWRRCAMPWTACGLGATHLSR